jgi:hypothetical protein
LNRLFGYCTKVFGLLRNPNMDLPPRIEIVTEILKPSFALLKIYPALYIFRLKLFFKTVSKFEYNRLFLRDHNFQSIFTAPWTRFPVL